MPFAQKIELTPPKLIIAGPPGGGKGIQAQLIRGELDVVHVSSGDLLRQHVLDNTKIGSLAKGFMERGELVPDDLVVPVIIERLKEEDCIKNGWLLDGFPRTKHQSEALAQECFECDAVILLELADEALLRRVSERRLDPETGITYHLDSVLPITGTVKDRMVQRVDDGDVAFPVKLSNFHEKTVPIIKSFEDKLVILNGNRPPMQVWADALEEVKRLIRKSIVFTIGTPCSGKRSHCSEIENNFGVRHLTLSDLINQEHYHDTEESRVIEYLVEQGRPLGSEIVVYLIQKAIYSYSEKQFIVDSFPRNMDDVALWNKVMNPRCVLDYVVFLNCPEEAIPSRLENRVVANQDGQCISAVAKRFKAFRSKTLPVVEYYRRCGKLREVSAIPAQPVVYEKVACLFEAQVMIKPYERSVLIIKPDAVANGYVPAILEKVKSELHLAILTTKFVVMTPIVVGAMHPSLLQSYLAPIESFLTSGPSLVAVVEGRDAINRLRIAIGLETAAEAGVKHLNSFRGLFGSNSLQNACQCSANDLHAIEDIDFWMNPSQLGYRCAVEGFQPDEELTDTSTNNDVVTTTRTVGNILHSSRSVSNVKNDEESSEIADLYLVKEEDTLALLKPCSSESRYREITSLLLGQGFRIVSEVKMNLTADHIDKLYGNRVGSIPYVPFLEFMQSGPVVALHLKRDSAVVGLRHLIGFDDISITKELRPDSIRALFAKNTTVNAIEGSETTIAADKELSFYFPSTYKSLSNAIEVPVYVPFGKDTPKYAERAKLAAKRRKKNQAPPPISLSRHTDMLKYLSDDVDMFFKDLIRRILIKRPKDVLGFAIKDLIEQQRLNLENSSKVKGSAVLKPISGVLTPQIDHVPSISVSSSCSALPSISHSEAVENTHNLAPSASGKLENFYLKENDDYDPTFNGKVLTTSFAHAEILRLRETIKTISGNISAEKSRIQSTVDDTMTKEANFEQPRILDILHIGDWVGFGHEFDDLLEGEKLARYVATIQSNTHNNELVLFSGNFLGASKNSTSCHFASMMKVVSIAGVNYGVLGNRDFEFGIEALEHHVESSMVTWLMSNVVDAVSKKPIANCERDAIIRWNGVMVGIMGFADHWISEIAGAPGKDFAFLDIFTTASELAKDLKSRGAEVVIALTHCSRQRVDEKLSSDENIDLVLGGHSELMDSWQLNGTSVGVRSSVGLHAVTKVSIKLESGEKVSVQYPPGVYSVHGDTLPDSKCSQVVEEMRELRAKAMTRKIGVTSVPLIGSPNLIRSVETNLGNIITDIMRFTLKTSFAFINSGAIRLDEDLQPGYITQGDIIKMLPYYDYVSVVRLSGKEIMNILKNSVSRTPFPDGRFLQVSGITFEYSTEILPPNDSVGSKCRFAKSGKKPIDNTSMYTCAMTGFLLNGNDGYRNSFRSHLHDKGQKDKELCISLHQIVYDFFRSRSYRNAQESKQYEDPSSLTLEDFDPISPEVSERMIAIKPKNIGGGYFSRSSTMADEEDGIETSINWDGGLIEGIIAEDGDVENSLEEGSTSVVVGDKVGDLDVPIPEADAKFRKIF